MKRLLVFVFGMVIAVVFAATGWAQAPEAAPEKPAVSERLEKEKTAKEKEMMKKKKGKEMKNKEKKDETPGMIREIPGKL